MTSKDFYCKMLDLKTKSENEECDIEYIHRAMDEIMCEALKDLGYGKGVHVFETTQKWYS